MLNAWNDGLITAHAVFSDNLWAWALLHAFVGACLASCAGLVVARLPARMMAMWVEDSVTLLQDKGVTIPDAIVSAPKADGLWWPPSRCDHCHSPLKWWHNVPVLGWLMLRGRCAFCGTRIPVAGWVAELIGAAGGAWIAVAVGVTPWAWWWMAGATLLGIAVWIDWRTGWLPDEVVLPLAWMGVLGTLCPQAIAQGHVPNLHDAVLGGVVGFGVLWALNVFAQVVFRKEGMGRGDMKLLGALGTWFGTLWVLHGLMVASFLGLAFTLVHRARKTHDVNHGFVEGGVPFGPSLALGVLIAWYVGQAGWISTWPIRLG